MGVETVQSRLCESEIFDHNHIETWWKVHIHLKRMFYY